MTTTTHRDACILLVDDNEMDVELALEAFSALDLDCRVEVANGGQPAIDYLTGVGEHADRTRYPLPDVVLLDLKMPRVDGFEVLRQVKATPVVCRVPIVVMTSSREETDLLTSYDVGANSYVLKPATLDEFLEVITLLERYWHRLNETTTRSTGKGQPGSARP